jgi:hypothetical protein
MLCCLLAAGAGRAADQVQVTLTEQGVQSLVFRGNEYCDPTGCGALGFSGGPVGIQDTKKSRESFALKPTGVVVNGTTITQTYPWGALAVTYTVKDTELDTVVPVVGINRPERCPPGCPIVLSYGTGLPVFASITRGRAGVPVARLVCLYNTPTSVASE